ncbi:MAG: pyridoxamine 5'-phosphate oxidase [bacterium]|nr:pyridoxamine 5'-phosphate oxidase [bacterium]
MAQTETALAREDPFERFGKVFQKAQATGMEDPNAMVLSSVDAGGQSSSRVVLLKDYDARGFVFYTNLESRKGTEILANPQVSLIFYWRELKQQVRVQGHADLVGNDEADAYFATRPRTSRLGAWASKQSQPLPSRAHLMARVAKYEAKYLTGPVPRPPHWSGFRVVPSTIEFWVAGAFRLHERSLFERTEDGWVSRRLYP